MAALIDTNLLVYGFDPRDVRKQDIAREVLRTGLLDQSVVVPHQAIVEFVSAVSRPCRDLNGAPILESSEALVEAESLMDQFLVLYPTAEVLTTAFRGMALYRMSWFDAHLWAYAEAFGHQTILSEDFQHGRHYGRVRVENPFLGTGGLVQELPALYSS